MNGIVEEDQVSISIDHNDEILEATSEDESTGVDSASGSSVGLELFVKNGLHQLDESSEEYTSVNKLLYLEGRWKNSEFAKNIKLVAIHKNVTSNLSKKARADAFSIFAKAVADKNGGDANLTFAWYGASKKESCEILTYGFSPINKAATAGDPNSFRSYICLSPAKFCFDSVLSSEVDEYGLRHLVLCRVILGKQELVPANSNQFHPSSEEFDTGVDNLSVPRKHIIWPAYMNSHIRPCYIISFKAPPLIGPKELLEAKNAIKPGSSWISFSTLIAMVSRFLSPSQVDCLNKFYRDFLEKKVTKAQMIAKLKEVAGMHVVAAVVDIYKKKKLEELPARKGR